MQRAAQRDRLEAVRLLLEAGAGLDTPDAHGMTPLMTAAFGGSLRVTLSLIEAGAEVNARHEPHEVTALEQALSGLLAESGMRLDAPLAGDRRKSSRNCSAPARTRTWAARSDPQSAT